MATRDIHTKDGLSLTFDHAAQYFTVSDPKFRKLVDRWIDEGAVKEWKGVVGKLQAGGKYSDLADDVPRYVGTHGMRPLADHMVSRVSYQPTQNKLISLWIHNLVSHVMKSRIWSYRTLLTCMYFYVVFNCEHLSPIMQGALNFYYLFTNFRWHRTCKFLTGPTY